MPEEKVLINLKIDKAVKEAFAALCKSKGATVSGEIKRFIYAEVNAAKKGGQP